MDYFLPGSFAGIISHSFLIMAKSSSGSLLENNVWKKEQKTKANYQVAETLAERITLLSV